MMSFHNSERQVRLAKYYLHIHIMLSSCYMYYVTVKSQDAGVSPDES